MSTVMISLTSEQAIPNVIASLQYEPRPDRVICLVSADLRFAEELRYASEFERAYTGVHDVLTDLGMEVTKTPPVHPYDLNHIMSVCRKVRNGFSRGERVIFNVTGGTKPMALGAALVARAQSPPDPIVYVDTERSCLIELQGEELLSRPFSEDRLSEISVGRYLQSYGVSITPEDPAVYPPEALDASRLILTDLEARNVVSELRSLIQQKGSRSGTYQLAHSMISGAGMGILERFHQYGLLQDCKERDDAREITLAPHQREYFKERWLTYYVYRTAEAVKDPAGVPLFSDCRFHGHLDWRGRPKSTDNEMDVLAVKAARLLLIECKSGGDEIGGNDVLKLQVIGRTCGTYAEKLLVTTAAKPVETSRRYFRETIRHALMAEIGVVGWEELLDLPRIFQDVSGYVETQRRLAGV